MHDEKRPASLEERTVKVNGGQLLDDSLADNATIRVVPGRTPVTFGTRFHDLENQLVEETYTDYESHYDLCATHDYKGRCESGSTRVATLKSRRVNRLVDVNIATCIRSESYLLDANRIYRIDYRFIEKNSCVVACSEVTEDGHETPCAMPQDVPSTSPPVSAQTTPTSTVPVTSPPEKVVRPLAPLGIAAITVGSLGIATGAMAGLLAFHSRDEVRRSCDSNQTCDRDGLAAARTGETASLVSTVGFAAGGALLFGGVVILAVGPSKTIAQPTIAIGPDGARVGMGATF
jgi:hypothetical protein